MISKLKEQPMPNWLGSASAPLGRLPLKEILDGSVYYPACGHDGGPVKFIGGNFLSFVYVDYGVGRESTLDALSHFRGYNVLAMRDVTAEELAPRGWRPPPVPLDAPRPPDGLVKPPFGLWAILERDAEYQPDHGPERFSLLFVGGDGIATFQAIYSGNVLAPAVIAVIQPGTAFGGNWTDFCDAQGPLAQAVMENPAGVPKMLLAGGVGGLDRYETPCWPSYGTFVAESAAIAAAWSHKDSRSLRLWCRNEESVA